MIPDEKAVSLLISMRPSDETDWSLWKALARFLQSVNAKQDFGMARAVGLAAEVCSSLGLNWDMNRFLENLPLESRRYLDATGEALEIYASIRRQSNQETLPAWELNGDALAELRRIREICLDPIGGCGY